jgi:hypothetical protein
MLNIFQRTSEWREDLVESEDLRVEMQLLERPPDFDLMSTTGRYWALVNGPLADVFRSAEQGFLFDASASATKKLATLQEAIRATLIAHGVAPRVAERWELYNSNLFGREAIGNVEESPVSVTLNCAPPPRDACLCDSPRVDENVTVPPRWTPDYLSAIVDALILEGFWPAHITPLCLEFRAVCPALLVLSDRDKLRPAGSCDALGCASANNNSMHGLLCGHFPEAATSPKNRSLLGGHLGIVHAAASASWLRLLHARAPASLGAAHYDHTASAVATGCGAATAGYVEAAAFLSEAPEVDGLGSVRALCIAAHHPGRDRYLAGQLLEENIRSWFVAGCVLLRMEKPVRDQGGGRLSASLAEATLQAATEARASWDCSLATRLVSAVIRALSIAGYGPVLAQGPHAAIVLAVAAEPGGSEPPVPIGFVRQCSLLL